MTAATPGKTVKHPASHRVVVTVSPLGTARWAEDARGNLSLIDWKPAR